jgi:cupin superfamily acireductone dioxygenase involved in methionine salvage
MTEQLSDKELIQNLLNQVKVLFNELKSTAATGEDKEFDLDNYKTELSKLSYYNRYHKLFYLFIFYSRYFR